MATDPLFDPRLYPFESNGELVISPVAPSSPRWPAAVMVSLRLRTFSLVKMLRRCGFTVVSLM